MSDELKPSPFCGNAPILAKFWSDGSARYRPMCSNKCAEMRWTSTAEEVTAKWNARPREDELVAEVERLTDVLQRYACGYYGGSIMAQNAVYGKLLTPRQMQQIKLDFEKEARDAAPILDESGDA